MAINLDIPKAIPDEAVQQEQYKTDSGSEKMAGEERRAFSRGDLKKRLIDSQDKTSIAIENVYRWGILFLFAVACFGVLYLGLKLTSLISSYVDFVKGDEEQLKELLRDLWKVLSGAAIVIFGQFLGWAIKNRHDGEK